MPGIMPRQMPGELPVQRPGARLLVEEKVIRSRRASDEA